MTAQDNQGATIGPVSSDIQTQLDLITLAESGASVGEIQNFITQHWELFQDSETTDALQDQLADTNFDDALIGAISENLSAKDLIEMMPLIGGLKGVSSIKYLDESGNILKEVAQKPGFASALKGLLTGTKNLITGGPGSSILRKAGGIAVAGGVGMQAIEGIMGGDSSSPSGLGAGGSGTGSQTGGETIGTFRQQSVERDAARHGGSKSTSTTSPRPPGPQIPQADNGFNIMMIDRDGSLTGTPGAVAVVSSAEVGLTPDLNVQNLINESLPVSGEGNDVISFLTSAIAQSNAQGLATQGRDVYQALFPQSVGVIGFDRPAQITAQKGPVYSSSTLPKTSSPVLARLPQEESDAVKQADSASNVNIPAGAQLSPRLFQSYNGRTLAEWASIAAQKYNVPLNLLYGIVQHESGWNYQIAGDNGQSWGLAQIHLPSWPAISKSMATNPVFALNWTAQKLQQRFQQYGRWDAAVAAHNKPDAAAYLAKTGKFLNEKSANYVGSVMDKANKSGLADYLFSTGEDIPTADSGSGVTYTPFQEPDPAESRKYITSVYEELLGRKPTDMEMTKEVAKISGLAKSSYSAELAKAKGKTSQAVDIEAQFEEGITESGEFAFHDETITQRNFTDYASSIARLMQQGL